MNPLVSIITPTFNGRRYINDCLQSVLNQNYPRIEHVIIDGASSDGTVEILRDFATQHPERVRFISEPDKNLGEAWNKGLKMAKGEILGWLGFDDMLYGSDSINTVVDFFSSHPQANFVHGGCNYINEDGAIISTHRTRDFDLDELINKDSCVAWPAAFYKRVVIDKVGCYDEVGSDLDYMIRITRLFPIHRVDNILANFRVRSDSITGCMETYVKDLGWDYVVMRKHGGRMLSKRARRYFKFWLIRELGLLSLCSYLKQRKHEKS